MGEGEPSPEYILYAPGANPLYSWSDVSEGLIIEPTPVKPGLTPVAADPPCKGTSKATGRSPSIKSGLQ